MYGEEQWRTMKNNKDHHKKQQDLAINCAYESLHMLVNIQTKNEENEKM
jgi:hypothetical protein